MRRKPKSGVVDDSDEWFELVRNLLSKLRCELETIEYSIGARARLSAALLDRRYHDRSAPADAPGFALTETESGLRQAHTSPVYVLIDDKPIAVRTSAEYMIRWIDRLIEVAEMPERYRRESDKAEVLAIYRQAREFYQNVATTTGTIWGE